MRREVVRGGVGVELDLFERIHGEEPRIGSHPHMEASAERQTDNGADRALKAQGRARARVSLHLVLPVDVQSLERVAAHEHLADVRVDHLALQTRLQLVRQARCKEATGSPRLRGMSTGNAPLLRSGAMTRSSTPFFLNMGAPGAQTPSLESARMSNAHNARWTSKTSPSTSASMAALMQTCVKP